MVKGVANIEWCSIFLSTLAYSMWKHRNGRLFEDKFNMFRAVTIFEENVEEFGFFGIVHCFSFYVFVDRKTCTLGTTSLWMD